MLATTCTILDDAILASSTDIVYGLSTIPSGTVLTCSGVAEFRVSDRVDGTIPSGMILDLMHHRAPTPATSRRIYGKEADTNIMQNLWYRGGHRAPTAGDPLASLYATNMGTVFGTTVNGEPWSRFPPSVCGTIHGGN
jgi:hypothetical protein